MDNQHRQIKGYRELSADEIALMNMIKEFGPQLEVVVKNVREQALDRESANWALEGELALKKGLMFLTRAVAKPTFF